MHTVPLNFLDLGGIVLVEFSSIFYFNLYFFSIQYEKKPKSCEKTSGLKDVKLVGEET